MNTTHSLDRCLSPFPGDTQVRQTALVPALRIVDGLGGDRWRQGPAISTQRVTFCDGEGAVHRHAMRLLIRPGQRASQKHWGPREALELQPFPSLSSPSTHTLCAVTINHRVPCKRKGSLCTCPPDCTLWAPPTPSLQPPQQGRLL